MENDVLVQGVKLPENCFRCFASYWQDFGCEPHGFQCRAIPNDQKIISNCEGRSGRRSDCPLSEIIANGRADVAGYSALIQELRSYTYWLGKDEPCSRDIHPPICDVAAAAIQSLLDDRAAADAQEPVQRARLKELAEADAKGLVLLAAMPIGTDVFKLNRRQSTEVRIIDGKEYVRNVQKWYVTHHNYSWFDAAIDAAYPERMNEPQGRYYLTRDAAIAERDRINAGGDPYATGCSAAESAGAYADNPTIAMPGA